MPLKTKLRLQPVVAVTFGCIDHFLRQFLQQRMPWTTQIPSTAGYGGSSVEMTYMPVAGGSCQHIGPEPWTGGLANSSGSPDC
jgi:hypothetical protein